MLLGGSWYYNYVLVLWLKVLPSGAEHQVNFISCSCEPLTATMVRAHLWPATPQNPHIAFSFHFLDWAEALMLECQVALKDLCKAVCYIQKYPIYKVHTIARSGAHSWVHTKGYYIIYMCVHLLYYLNTCRYKFTHSFSQKKDIYQSLIDSLEEYRYSPTNSVIYNGIIYFKFITSLILLWI